ncbi:MAG: VCBS repeat-containing protein [Verrucomicrobia bacterium]|nr:VCBS repeat-containing protein [Cytophagales bacterium]
MDFDKDGNMDLFVGGHIKPFDFPRYSSSFLLKNKGQGIFEKVDLPPTGMVTDACVVDLNQDGWQDLLLVGEWMPVTPMLNQAGKTFSKPQNPYPSLQGWWHTLASADLDKDGDLDFILGNHGLNTQLRASEKEPATLIFGDFDDNLQTDFFINYYIQGKSYPACSRDEISEQTPAFRKKFTSYQAFSTAETATMLDESQAKKTKKLTINTLKTWVLENKNGQLIPHELPLQTQVAPVYAIAVADMNANGLPDLILSGNNSKLRMRLGGKTDANHGVLLINRGNWKFEYVPALQTALNLRGDVRSFVQVGDYWFAGINNEEVKIFKVNK